MNANEYKSVVDFERKLKVGQEVRIRWTNSGGIFSGLGHVKKINRESVLVTLSEEVGGPNAYPVGRTISAPLLTLRSGGKVWSANNRVEPVTDVDKMGDQEFADLALSLGFNG